jgi:CRISPR-associated protein Cst2
MAKAKKQKSKNTLEVKAITIDFISKTTIGSVNGADTEIENAPTVKKITLREGVQIPYISAQAIKRYIRDIWHERGLKLSEPQATKGKGVQSTKRDPLNYIDDDLFGFMFEEKERRTAPVRIKPAHGNLIFFGDKDYGTHMQITQEGSREAGNIFETEMYYNYFSNTVLIEVDRIGCGRDPKENFKGKECSRDVKTERLTYLLEAIRDLWGGGRQSRFLTDISPKFTVISFLKVKKPFLLEVIGTDDKGNIKIENIKSAIAENIGIIDTHFIGISDGVFSNTDEVKKTWANISTTRDAFNKAIEKLKETF